MKLKYVLPDFKTILYSNMKVSGFIKEYGAERDTERNQVTDKRCYCRALNAESRKPEPSADKQIIKNTVDYVCNDIGGHCDTGVSASSVSRIYRHTDSGEQQTDHRNAEVSYRVVNDNVLRSGEFEQRISGKTCGGTQQDSENQRQADRLSETSVCTVAVALSGAAADYCRNTDINRKKHSIEQHSRLTGYPDSRDRIRAEHRYHLGVDESHKPDKRAFQHGRPCNRKKAFHSRFSGGYFSELLFFSQYIFRREESGQKIGFYISHVCKTLRFSLCSGIVTLPVLIINPEVLYKHEKIC